MEILKWTDTVKNVITWCLDEKRLSLTQGFSMLATLMSVFASAICWLSYWTTSVLIGDTNDGTFHMNISSSESFLNNSMGMNVFLTLIVLAFIVSCSTVVMVGSTILLVFNKIFLSVSSKAIELMKNRGDGKSTFS